MLRHSHSPSVASWRCVLRFLVLHCGLCVQSPPGCHFLLTQLRSDLPETDDTYIWISWINSVQTISPSVQFGFLQHLAKIFGFFVTPFPEKQYKALLIICFLPTQNYLCPHTYAISHSLPRWLILFGTLLMILSYNKVLLSVLILLASSLWWAQMETGSEGITRCASSVVYRQ